MNDDEIIQRALELLQRRAAGVGAPSITVRQLFDKYKTANQSRKSWWTIEDKLLPFVESVGNRDVMSLRVIDWSDYRAEREKQEIPRGAPGRFRSAHTINCELQWAKAMFSWGVAQGRIPHNPIAAAKNVRTKSKRSTAPNEDEVGRLLALADEVLRVVILCAADSGMRRSEILGLRWEWVDKEDMAIRLPAWICKSGKARTVPLTTRTLEAMEALPRHLRSSYVLTNPDTGDPYSKVTVTNWFRDIARRSGVQAAPGEQVVMHSLRHGFATNAVRRGVRLEVVSGMLGHASLDQTRDYIEVVDVDVAEGRAIFEAGIVKEQARRGPKRIENSDVVSHGDEKSKTGKK